MIRYIIVIYLILCSSLAYSQRVKVSVNGIREKQLFKLYYNRIQLSIKNVPCDQISIKGDNLDIKQNNCLLYVRVLDYSKPTSITIFKKGKEKAITTINFSLKDSIPSPILKINGKKRMELGTGISEETDSLYCKPYFEDIYNSLIRFQVVSFEIEVLKDGNSIYSEKNQGNRLSQKIKEHIMLLTPKDRLVFKDVLIIDESGNEYFIPQKILRPNEGW